MVPVSGLNKCPERLLITYDAWPPSGFWFVMKKLIIAIGIKTWWISTHHRYGLLHSSVPEAMQRAQVVQFLEEDFPGSSMPYDELMLPYVFYLGAATIGQ